MSKGTYTNITRGNLFIAIEFLPWYHQTAMETEEKASLERQYIEELIAFENAAEEVYPVPDAIAKAEVTGNHLAPQSYYFTPLLFNALSQSILEGHTIYEIAKSITTPEQMEKAKAQIIDDHRLYGIRHLPKTLPSGYTLRDGEEKYHAIPDWEVVNLWGDIKDPILHDFVRYIFTEDEGERIELRRKVYHEKHDEQKHPLNDDFCSFVYGLAEREILADPIRKVAYLERVEEYHRITAAIADMFCSKKLEHLFAQYKSTFSRRRKSYENAWKWKTRYQIAKEIDPFLIAAGIKEVNAMIEEGVDDAARQRLYDLVSSNFFVMKDHLEGLAQFDNG